MKRAHGTATRTGKPGRAMARPATRARLAPRHHQWRGVTTSGSSPSAATAGSTAPSSPATRISSSNTSLTTEDQWKAGAGPAASAATRAGRHHRVGAPMDGRRNYDAAGQPPTAFVAFIRGVAAEARTLQLGTVYWPACASRHVPAPADQRQRNQLSLTTTSASGQDQLRIHGGSTPTCRRPPPAPTTGSTNRNSGKVMDVIGRRPQQHAVDQWTWNGGRQPEMVVPGCRRRAISIIVNRTVAKCLDVGGPASTADAANIIQYTCGTGNQPASGRCRPSAATSNSSPRTAGSVSTWPALPP